MNKLPLKDIILPNQPSIFPLAIGWWVVIVIAILLLIAIFWFIRRQILKRRRQTKVEDLFNAPLLEYKKKQNPHQYAIEVSTLLRRFVRYELGNESASTLEENNWLQYMIKTAPKAGKIIENQFQDIFLFAKYNPNIQFDVLSYHQTLLKWVHESYKTKKGN